MTGARANLLLVLVVVLCAARFVGCGGDKGKQPAGPEPPTDEIAGGGEDGEAGGGEDGTGGGEGAEVATGGGGAQVDTEPAVPTEGDPNDHFLGHGDLFAGRQGYDQGIVYVEPAIEIAPPGETGKGTFKIVRTGKHLETEHFWKTHKAQKTELKVGVIALMADRKDAQGIYAAPKTVDEAYGGRWWMARIASVKPLESKGFVWVAGGYKIAADAIRILDGDGSPALTLEGGEDKHFIRVDHWVAGAQPLPDKGNVYASISVVVRPFEGGEGRFMALHNGKIFDTSHAWQTRIANAKDIAKGVHVLVPDIRDGSKYRAPKTRKEALFSRWWWVKIEKKKGKQTVVVDGDYLVATDALRVAK
ncbi:MAG: hypothetical protein JRF63_05990 [Deltaproteobacteria bacterium]|nr:hypothetical protein [Deltaproteobacteria bacterium]